MPTEKSILFNGPMVRAILSGQKTVTRRACKPQPSANAHTTAADGTPMGSWWETGKNINRCPYGQPGERLWVRETWYCDHDEVLSGPYLQPADLDLVEARDNGALVYAADGLTPYECEQPIWKPSIHMPRWACRILLEITAVHVERLQDISEESAHAEGVSHESVEAYRRTGVARPAGFAFRDLWQSVYGEESWTANPWVWAVEFKRVEP